MSKMRHLLILSSQLSRGDRYMSSNCHIYYVKWLERVKKGRTKVGPNWFCLRVGRLCQAEDQARNETGMVTFQSRGRARAKQGGRDGDLEQYTWSGAWESQAWLGGDGKAVYRHFRGVFKPIPLPTPSSLDFSLAGPSAFEWGKAGSDYRIFKSEPLHSDLSSFLGIETAIGQRNYFITTPNKLPGELKHNSA